MTMALTDTELQACVATWYEEGKEAGRIAGKYVDVPDDLLGCAEWCGACESEFSRYACWMGNEAQEGEANSREYSPFEFTASDLNSYEEFDSEELWQSYDEGITAGIEAEIVRRLAQLGLEGNPFPS